MTVGVTALPIEMVLKTMFISQAVRVENANADACEDAFRLHTRMKHGHKMCCKSMALKYRSCIAQTEGACEVGW